MKSKIFQTRLLSVLIAALVLIMTVGVSPNAAISASAQGSSPVTVVRDYKHDVSPPVRSIVPLPLPQRPEREETVPMQVGHHQSQSDPVVQSINLAAAMPGTMLNFDGIPFPGVACNCAPPDTNGEVGATQYVQIVNEGFQVFNKSTGASMMGPTAISTLWSGFGGVCQSNGSGDPVVLYDQLANRWVISQFAGVSVPTDECIAVSTTSDASGSYNRYGFHLGTHFFDYPKLSVWPDGYYMSMNVFSEVFPNPFLGPQPFAFNRAAMLAGNSATFITTGITGGSTEDSYLPADLDGSTLPPAGAPNTFVEWPGNGSYKLYHFHVDFATPANTTFTLFTTVSAAGFTQLCSSTRACVPQAGVTSSNYLDAIADRLMFRLAYRNFGDHESLVGNYTVSASSVAGVRWFELRNVTSGPVTKYQESTYQPDSTWRWMGSAAMDGSGNLAIGYSASSSSINPQIRYAGRLASDPLNTLAQGETTLFAGTGSQSGTSNRWGDYSDLTVDPVDDCTFWYTSEYYATTGSFNWRTRIGSFKFASCGGSVPTPTPTNPATNTPTPTITSTPTNTPTSTNTPIVTNTPTPTATPQGATVPSSPQNLTAAAAKGKGIQLNWSPPASNGGSAITGYKIYRGTVSGGETVLTTVGNVTSYKDSSTSRGVIYYYKVTAVNSVGEGPASNEATATAK